MTWRAPNRLRSVQHRPSDHINGFIHSILATIALVIFLGLLLGALTLGFLLVNTRLAWPQSAVGASELTIKFDCTPDALKLCKLAIPRGRDAIIACMLENKDKLRSRCRRHMWD